MVIGITGNRLMIEMEQGLTIFFSGFSLSTSSILPLLAPLLAALPMADAYINDSQNNMTTAIFTRQTKKKYFMNKFVSVGFSGFLALFIPLSLLLAVNLMIYPDFSGAYVGTIGGAFSEVYEKNQLLYAMILIFNSSIFGFIYANVGLVSSFFFKNKYICVFFPLLVYFVPSFVFPFLGLDRYEPVTTFDITSNTSTTVFLITVQLFVLASATFLMGYQKITKRT
ncbi:hypothetical protein D920_01100 [Enterococcus faecalis 13-SD-W-01]|nr:hypothetical protein D920_01100 [Enterococcus faecalis 13-SD-W-01]